MFGILVIFIRLAVLAGTLWHVWGFLGTFAYFRSFRNSHWVPLGSLHIFFISRNSRNFREICSSRWAFDIFQVILRVLVIFCSFRNSRWVPLQILLIRVILVIFVKFAVLVGSLWQRVSHFGAFALRIFTVFVILVILVGSLWDLAKFCRFRNFRNIRSCRWVPLTSCKAFLAPLRIFPVFVIFVAEFNSGHISTMNGLWEDWLTVCLMDWFID